MEGINGAESSTGLRTTSDQISLRRVDFNDGVSVLETQVLTGGIIDPNTGFRFEPDLAVKRNLVSKVFIDELSGITPALVEGTDKDTLTSMLEHDKVCRHVTQSVLSK